MQRHESFPDEHDYHCGIHSETYNSEEEGFCPSCKDEQVELEPVEVDEEYPRE